MEMVTDKKNLVYDHMTHPIQTKDSRMVVVAGGEYGDKQYADVLIYIVKNNSWAEGNNNTKRNYQE